MHDGRFIGAQEKAQDDQIFNQKSTPMFRRLVYQPCIDGWLICCERMSLTFSCQFHLVGNACELYLNRIRWTSFLIHSNQAEKSASRFDLSWLSSMARILLCVNVTTRDTIRWLDVIGMRMPSECRQPGCSWSISATSSSVRFFVLIEPPGSWCVSNVCAKGILTDSHIDSLKTASCFFSDRLERLAHCLSI